MVSARLRSPSPAPTATSSPGRTDRREKLSDQPIAKWRASGCSWPDRRWYGAMTPPLSSRAGLGRIGIHWSAPSRMSAELVERAQNWSDAVDRRLTIPTTVAADLRDSAVEMIPLRRCQNGHSAARESDSARHVSPSCGLTRPAMIVTKRYSSAGEGAVPTDKGPPSCRQSRHPRPSGAVVGRSLPRRGAAVRPGR
jgi:hypothetical protein